eukprot:NODE_132_length_16614_cov_0.935392.p11 type:complete len:195 gc:universal NODE_132_length_16614_cov_0.935392:12903-13487(+)
MSQGQMDAVDDLLDHRKRDQEALATALQPKSGKSQSDIEECKSQLERIGENIRHDVTLSEKRRAILIRRTITKILSDQIECQRQAVLQWDSYSTDISRKGSAAVTHFTQEAFILGSESEDEKNTPEMPKMPLTPEIDLSSFPPITEIPELSPQFVPAPTKDEIGESPINPNRKIDLEGIPLSSPPSPEIVDNPW